jgi:hypothetical protein
VGVFPPLHPICSPGKSLPHARGGVSTGCAVSGVASWSSPRPWGCFSATPAAHSAHTVFPTPVGVFPLYKRARDAGDCLPHARGGVSLAWCSDVMVQRVFPTPVGVFPRIEKNELAIESLPHARGGVSCSRGCRWCPISSSPRPWGCFLRGGDQAVSGSVFPTPVGVFPGGKTRSAGQERLPHARGGVSTIATTVGNWEQSSPRPWGCFSLGAVIVAAWRGLPHARGGVSWNPGWCVKPDVSSPRPWGCFQCRRAYRRSRGSLPHARGGVSCPYS